MKEAQNKKGIEVKVSGLCYKFGCIQDLEFELFAGEHLMVLGENGTGKTTLLRLLAGILKPENGEILLDNKAPQENPKFTIGYIPQSTDSSQFDLSVEEVVSLGGSEFIDEALSKTNSLHLKGRGFCSLSGGEKQKVSFARCLAQNAKILLLDEPTASLDNENKKMVVELLGKFVEKDGPTIIMVTHDKELSQLEGWKILHLGEQS